MSTPFAGVATMHVASHMNTRDIVVPTCARALLTKLNKIVVPASTSGRDRRGGATRKRFFLQVWKHDPGIRYNSVTGVAGVNHS